MKKIISIIFCSLALSAAFAKTYNYEEFSLAVMKAYPFVDYVADSVWREWNGDAEKFIQYLKDNPTDIDTEEMEVFNEK